MQQPYDGYCVGGDGELRNQFLRWILLDEQDQPKRFY